MENVLQDSSIFLTVVCGILLCASFLFNFTFLVILLKMRRLNRLDKSNLFVTHLIVADFLCSFFILVPSGYSVFNSKTLEKDGCHVQTYFTTFFLSLTFQGMLVLSIERWIKYQFPIFHINFFIKRLKYDADERPKGDRLAWKTLLIILAIWLFNIFIAFIPMFNNFGDIQYFPSQSQCDYIYEKFNWWLWIFFIIFMTVPFLASLVFHALTLRLVILSDRIVKMKKNQFDVDEANGRKLRANQAENFLEGIDISRQPSNVIFYSHILPLNGEEEENQNNDFHVRNQLLAQYKYNTDKSKVITFVIITIVNYVLIFPLFVMHFYRTYNSNGPNENGSYDNPNLFSKGAYTTMAWISYFLLIAKSFVCLVQNKFYRDSLYQSANCRGFNGLFDFQKNMDKFKDMLNIDEDDENTKKEETTNSREKLRENSY
jgi:hypothetical protein